MSDKPEWAQTGVVFCTCGGQILSNSGKGYYNVKENVMHCWQCEFYYDVDAIHKERVDGQHVVTKQVPLGATKMKEVIQ